MTLETIYSASSAVALAGWLLLILAPLGRARLVMAARGVALLLCAAYLTEFFTIVEPSGGDFNSLAGIVQLFSKPGNVMLGWSHYLAFDLFIGTWEIEDAGRRGVPHWAMVPVLALTLLVGPVGLLAYFVVRTVFARLRPVGPAA